MTVGILTSAGGGDLAVERVAARLRARGVPVERLEVDRFPGDALVTHALGRNGRDDEVRIAGVDVRALRSLWLRFGEPGARLPDAMDHPHRAIATGQAQSALTGVLDCVDALVVDRPRAVDGSARVRTLQLARACGFAIPRTVITNDPERLRAFVQECGGDVVVRFVEPNLVASALDDHAPSRTRWFDPSELDDPIVADGLRLAPMQFQERVRKALELRVTIVGAQVFTAAVDSSESALGALDWREDPELVKGFVPHDLPLVERTQLLALCDRMGLNFATADIILTPGGEHVLLEVNSTSYYDFVEDATGLPISEAVADLLDGTRPPRWLPST